jgi:putative component of membrane protein insertase Oxa1/YidC/SpoIIIJ protein YidD
MRFVFVFFFLVGFFISEAQSKLSFQDKLVTRTFKEYEIQIPQKRKFLSTKNKTFIAKLNPLNYVFGAVIFVYQRGFSEQIQADCTYETSCSSFTRLCMEKYGPVRGLLMGIDQLSCCFPGVSGEVEKWRINRLGKVINFPVHTDHVN